MTADKQPLATEKVLEDILDIVESIGKNVEELLERVGEHLDESRYRMWREDCPGYH